MRYRPKILNLSGNRDLESWAIGKHQALERARLTANVPLLERQYMVDGITCLIQACSLSGGKIIMMDGTEGQIMLAADINGGAAFSTYDYLKNKIASAASLTGFSFGTTPLSALHNRRCQLGELAQISGTSKWSASELGGEALEFLGLVNAYEQAYFAGTDGIWARHSQGLQQISNIPSGHLLLPSLSGSFLNLFSFASYPTTEFWNQYRGASLFSITPTNGVVQEYGAWVPSFFVVEPADFCGLQPGWYYGKYPSPRYDMDNPLESLAVSLCAVMETRCYPGLYTKGWCEMVTAVNGVDQSDLLFYFEGMTTPGNDYAYRELVTGLYTHAFITIGSVLSGHSAAFSLTATTSGAKPDEVKLWNFESYTSGTSTSVDAVGVLVVEGTRCRGYRYKGYTAEFVDTAFFHSYAISNNGQMVAIFESTDGSLITSVKVYDLFGSRDKELAEDPDYSAGGYTLVRDSEVVAPLTALTGCFIPFREEKFEPSQAVFSSVSSPVPDSRNEFPSLSSLRFMKSATGGLQIDKVVCENGIDATFGSSSDPCFASTIVVDDPDLVTDTDRLVSKWDEGGNWRGVVRGNFEGSHPDMRFSGRGEGSSGWYGIITLNPTLSIMKNEDGIYSIDGVAGEIISTSCLTEEMELDPLCIPDCQGTITITAASSCGQTGKHVIEQEPAILLISGPDTFSGSFVASGGTPPHKFSSSCGEINETTGEVVSLTGCCGEVIVTVEDVCGQIASMPVRGPSGAWNTVSITDKVDDTIYTCTSQYDTSDRWKGFCDISNCYCGSEWYYLGPTLRFHTCKVPGWGPGFLIDDCSRSYCYVVTQRFECTSIPHVIDC